MSRTASLACAVIRQAMDDIETYLRALHRHGIRIADVGEEPHKKLIRGNYSDLVNWHRSAICAASFLSGADSHADISKVWFDASGLDAKTCKLKTEAMYPIRQLLAMG